MSIKDEFTKGFWKTIAPFRLVLGLCPVLAVTTTGINGMGMGLATTFVLVFSNLFVSLLRKFIPREVRIASFIVIIASFVVIVELVMQAYFYQLFKILGIFIPLIVVNCIILALALALPYPFLS
jgi:electron transport complex protein RnfE